MCRRAQGTNNIIVYTAKSGRRHFSPTRNSARRSRRGKGTDHYMNTDSCGRDLSAPDGKAAVRTVALAGNPNVGKSTVFNALTGMNQHTGNWPGKTVSVASGTYTFGGRQYRLVDIPGTYSLSTHSAEEDVARDFICFGGCDAAVVVCDASCLERNLNLVLQVAQAAPRTVVCVNLMDEARRKGIETDLCALEKELGVAVVGTVARKKRTLRELVSKISRAADSGSRERLCIGYPEPVEAAVAAGIGEVATALAEYGSPLDARWVMLRLIESDAGFADAMRRGIAEDFFENAHVKKAMLCARGVFEEADTDISEAGDIIASALVQKSEEICRRVVKTGKKSSFDARLDRVLCGRFTAYPVMLMLLCFIFWLTLVGANYPSQALSALLLGLEDKFFVLLSSAGIGERICEAIVFGAYRVLAWVVSVMLPPMAIFFPLFTLLEDFGYLPRIAYNLDRPFQRCRACGKQALTMCMGFGCNAAGVVGCRIIDSPRERLLALLTNNFIPCNGRLPMMLTLICVFFTSGGTPNAVSVLILCAVILVGVGATFGVTRLLSATLLRGKPSSFTLELPPYRVPQVGKVIVRSVFDRTLYVLGRAAAIAAPAGLIIWLCANVQVGNDSILGHMCAFLEPLGSLMGLDGTVLAAFILGLPANEIVVPVMLMGYMSGATLTDVSGTAQIGGILAANGWTPVTAVCMLIFTLMHWPCSTTLITVYKETRSVKWTLAAALVPSICGFTLCCAVNGAAHLIQYLM